MTLTAKIHALLSADPICGGRVTGETVDAIAEILAMNLTRAPGNYGQAYDQPGPRRAFTYRYQPGNQEAYQLGMAAIVAVKCCAGDYIDRGLSLLKALEGAGFGVFAIERGDFGAGVG